MDIPQTANYLYLGLGSIAFFALGYVVTLWVRGRNLDKDLELIQRIAEDE